MIQWHGLRKCETGQRRAAIAANSRCNVPVHLIDLLRLEGLADHHATAFDKNGHDAAPPEIFEYLFKREVLQHEGAIFELIGEEQRVGWEISTARENNAPGLLFAGAEVRIAESESGIVSPQSLGPNDDGVSADTKPTSVRACRLAGDPLGLTWRSGDAPVEALACFDDDPWGAGHDPLRERLDQLLALSFQDSARDLNATGTEHGEALVGMRGIGIGGTKDDAADADVLNGLSAGRRAAMRGAGLERDVNSGSVEGSGIELEGIVDGDDLGVRCACFPMKTRADDATFGADNQGSDGRIGAGEPDPTLGQINGLTHVSGVRDIRCAWCHVS